MMKTPIRQSICRVVSVQEVAENIHVLAFQSEAIARTVRPGQFLNVRVAETTDPLLRRPFSVYRTVGERVEIIFNVVGRGTAALRMKRPGESVDVLGPLGVPFGIDDPDFSTAILVAGGLGVAPLPIATVALKAAGKTVQTFLGARTARSVVSAHLDNVRFATDDGTTGFHGTVVDLLRDALGKQSPSSPKIFGCGPTPMLRALADLAVEANICCEISLEGPMACGIGICQGCPVEMTAGEKKYSLMCTDGPVFDVRTIKL